MIVTAYGNVKYTTPNTVPQRCRTPKGCHPKVPTPKCPHRRRSNFLNRKTLTPEEVRNAEEGAQEEQIITALKQYESGEKVADICRKLGVSQASFYTLKNSMPGWACRSCVSCGSSGNSRRLKRLVADLSL